MVSSLGQFRRRNCWNGGTVESVGQLGPPVELLALFGQTVGLLGHLVGWWDCLDGGTVGTVGLKR